MIILSVSITLLANCGDDSEEAVLAFESGNIHGTVTDEETGDPIEGASVNIGGKVVLTDSNGEYIAEGIPFSDGIDVLVTATNYREYDGTISLDQESGLFDISLESPLAQILEVLNAITRDIEALDPGRIGAIQSYLSRDYTASRDLVTSVAVWAGVIPRDYDALPETVMNVVDKYSKLELDLVDPRVEFSGDSASARMRFEVYSETKPPKPQKWEIVVNGRMDLKKQNGDWKITYWKLVSDFIKFDWKPL